MSEVRPRTRKEWESDRLYNRYVDAETQLNKRLSSLQTNIGYYKKQCDQNENYEVDVDKINAMFDEIENIKWAKQCIQTCKKVYMREKEAGRWRDR